MRRRRRSNLSVAIDVAIISSAAVGPASKDAKLGSPVAGTGVCAARGVRETPGATPNALLTLIRGRFCGQRPWRSVARAKLCRTLGTSERVWLSEVPGSAPSGRGAALDSVGKTHPRRPVRRHRPHLPFGRRLRPSTSRPRHRRTQRAFSRMPARCKQSSTTLP
jgi:hypothetical protein